MNIAVDRSQPPCKFQPYLYNILTYTLNIINIDKRIARLQQGFMTSESDFITKYLSNFLQSIIFAFQDCLFLRWDVRP